jgi:hypothetical protein
MSQKKKTKTKTKYPNPATERNAEEFRLSLRKPPEDEFEAAVHDDLYHFIRYGLAEYDPATDRLRGCGPDDPEEYRARRALLDANEPGYELR